MDVKSIESEISKITNDESQHRQKSKSVPDVPKSNGNNATIQDLLNRTQSLLNEGNPEAALKVLAVNIDSRELKNARAVCLMRIGKYAEALQLYRSYVFERNCPCIKAELPVHQKTNFALCLLLNQLPDGCHSLLCEISCEDYPAIKRMRDAITSWEKTLTWGQWLNWRVCGVNPKGMVIEYVDVIGSLYDELSSVQ